MSCIYDQLVQHERFSSALAVILAAVERARNKDYQIQPVVGPTRVGKTRVLARAIQEVLRTSPVGSQSVISVVSPKHLTARALPDACLSSIGMSTGGFKNHVAATEAFIKAANKRKTELIIFDECQHMLERGSSTTVRAAADFFKLFDGKLEASIVLAGLPSLNQLFQENEQLADRVRRPFQFYPYDWQGPDYTHFRAALATALQYLTSNGWRTFDLKDAEFAKRMYIACAGRFGLIVKLFREVEVCSTNGEALYPEFANAYEAAVIGRLIDFNPFDIRITVQIEYMALVYSKVMAEAGVKV